MKAILILYDDKGGIIHYISQLANSLSKKINVTLISQVKNKSMINFDDKIKKIITNPITISLLKRQYIFPNYISIINNIKKEDPDLIHFTHPSIHNAILILLIKLLNTKPVISTIHDSKPHKGERFRLLTIFVQIIMESFSSSLIVHGESIKKDINKIIVKNKEIFIIPHGDFSFLNENIISENNAQKHEVLFFGRIVDYKGLDYLIEAEKETSKVIPDLVITIAGSGDFSKYEQRIKGNNHFRIINKFIPDQEIPILFNRASVVVLPYIDASQSGVISIAYAFRKPVIASNVGSIADIVIDGVTGYLILPRNAKMLSDALIKILTNANMQNEMGKNAHEFMVNNLSWDSISDKTIVAYKNTINMKNKILDKIN
jgi:alpha-maltose-1-phosphate synthase